MNQPTGDRPAHAPTSSNPITSAHRSLTTLIEEATAFEEREDRLLDELNRLAVAAESNRRAIDRAKAELIRQVVISDDRGEVSDREWFRSVEPIYRSEAEGKVFVVVRSGESDRPGDLQDDGAVLRALSVVVVPC